MWTMPSAVPPGWDRPRAAPGSPEGADLGRVDPMSVIFEPGELIYCRHFQRADVAGIFPLRVVRHDAEGLLLWADPTPAPGTRSCRTAGGCGRRRWPSGRPRRRCRTTARSRTRCCRGIRPGPTTRSGSSGTTASLPPGTPTSNCPSYLAEGRFVRNGHGRLGPGHLDRTRPHWRWKDEEEFTARLAEPSTTGSTTRPAYAQRAEEVQADRGRRLPVRRTWLDFPPDPAWEPLG